MLLWSDPDSQHLFISARVPDDAWVVIGALVIKGGVGHALQDNRGNRIIVEMNEAGDAAHAYYCS